MSDRLSKRQRQERILERLGSDVTVRISTLAEQFDVTTETIRRDIDDLTDKGLVDRTYGGAASKSLSREPAMEQRRLKQVAERERIASYATSLIEPGDVVMIDAGSTTLHFARALAIGDMELTVLTNCLPVAYALGPMPKIRHSAPWKNISPSTVRAKRTPQARPSFTGRPQQPAGEAGVRCPRRPRMCPTPGSSPPRRTPRTRLRDRSRP